MERRVRIAVVQYRQEPVAGFDDFAGRLAHCIGLAAEGGASLVLFPEYLTLQLLSAFPRLDRDRALELLTASAEAFTLLLRDLARRHRLWVIGGTHLCLEQSDESARNRCFIADPEGRLYAQDKLHPTPDERAFWGIAGGEELALFDAGVLRFGVLVCYDSEFPEAARALAEAGAELVLVPFATEDRAGYLRVRSCAQARAVENQCYVALAGNVGWQSAIPNFAQHYARSAVLTPLDLGFPPEGVLVAAEPGEPRVLIAELDLALLLRARREGTVRNLADRRFDLFPRIPAARPARALESIET